jgi:hypothetical protein
VGTRGEGACGVKRGHRGHLEIIGNHTTKLVGKDGKREKRKGSLCQIMFGSLV